MPESQLENLEFVKLELKENGLARIEIQKEKSLNALNTQVLKELLQVLSSKEIESARVVSLRGAGGKAFVAGADISEMKDFSSVQAAQFSELGHKVFHSLEKLNAVTLALVDGFALGGGFELALATDIILATEQSKFALPEVGLGLIPGFGGTQRLSRSVGLHFAKAMTLTTEMISAKELEAKSLVFRVYASREELLEAEAKWSKKITSKGPKALEVSKKTIQRGSALKLSEANALEQQEFALLFGAKESQEGISAFLEKRKAEF